MYDSLKCCYLYKYNLQAFCELPKGILNLILTQKLMQGTDTKFFIIHTPTRPRAPEGDPMSHNTNKKQGQWQGAISGLVCPNPPKNGPWAVSPPGSFSFQKGPGQEGLKG